jgi:hypothetical protein
MVAAILLAVSLSTILVHWHQDSRGQDCNLCHVQEMSGIQSPQADLLAAPTADKWTSIVHELVYNDGVILAAPHGRAPPVAYSI